MPRRNTLRKLTVVAMALVLGLIAVPVERTADQSYAEAEAHIELRVDGRDRLVAVAGTGDDGYRNGPRDAARLSLPGALAISPGGALVVVDQGDSMVRVVNPDADGSFTSVEQAVIPEVPRLEGVRVGRVNEPGGILNYPHGIALDADGSIIVADTGHHAIRRITPEGAMQTVAGGAGEGSRNGPRDQAQFSWPSSVAVDPRDVVCVADTGNGLIRRVALDGTVTTVGGREQPFTNPRGWPSIRRATCCSPSTTGGTSSASRSTARSRSLWTRATPSWGARSR